MQVHTQPGNWIRAFIHRGNHHSGCGCVPGCKLHYVCIKSRVTPLALLYHDDVRTAATDSGCCDWELGGVDAGRRLVAASTT
jgi:hypothetical protein